MLLSAKPRSAIPLGSSIWVVLPWVFRGQRRIRGGRASVRNTLYMAAVAAVRSKGDIATFYQRLRDSGIPFKVAITAVIRKLAVIANTLITENRKWEPQRP